MISLCSINWWLILEYFKLVLSWPVIIGLGVFCSIQYFSVEIKALINRIESAEFPGGKINAPNAQLEKLKQEPNTEEIKNQSESGISQFEKFTLSKEEIQEIQDIFQAEKAAARVWEYRYLNYLFVPITQTVLDWFISLDKSTTIDAYEAFWMNIITLQTERRAVLEALQRHYFILLNNEIISVTDKGREYAQWNERKILNLNN